MPAQNPNTSSSPSNAERIRDNMHFVFHLLRQFADERHSSFNDVISSFLQSLIMGYFDHGEGPISTREHELDLIKSHPVPLSQCPRFLPTAPIHEKYGVNHDSILGWTTTYDAHPEGTRDSLRNRFSSSQKNPVAFHEWYSKIPATEYKQAGLHKLLRELYIDKHDFARWVTETFNENPPMLASLKADPDQSWIRRQNRYSSHQNTKREAIDAGVPARILDTIDSTDWPSNRSDAKRS